MSAEPIKCHGCGSPEFVYKPHKWVVSPRRHDFTHSIVIIEVMPCCLVQAHTEALGSVVDYCRDGWKIAQRICELWNTSHGYTTEPLPEQRRTRADAERDFKRSMGVPT